MTVVSNRVDLSGHGEIEVVHLALQEVGKARKDSNAAALACRVLIEPDVLTLEADFDGVRSAAEEQRVADLEVTEKIVARQPEIARHLGDQSLNCEVPELFVRDPGHGRRDVDRPHVVRQRYRAIDAAVERVEQRRGKQMAVLDGQVLVARPFLREHNRRLESRLPIHVSIVEGVPAKERVAIQEAVIDSTLSEVLVGRLGPREPVLGGPSTKRPPVGVRKQRVEIGGDSRVQLDLPGGQEAHPCVVVGHGGHPGDAEPFDERLDRSEEECAVLSNRTAEDAAHLMTEKIGNRLVRLIEVVLRVEHRVAVELERRPGERVLPRARHGVDDPASRPAELGGEGIGEHLELAHRLDAQQYPGRRSGRLVVNVINVGPIEQKAALLGPRAVDRDFRRSPSDHVVSGGERGRHAGLQQRELLERSPVERQLPDLLVADEPADGARREVDVRRVGRDGHFVGDSPHFQLHVDDGILTDGELDASPDDRLKAIS